MSLLNAEQWVGRGSGNVSDDVRRWAAQEYPNDSIGWVLKSAPRPKGRSPVRRIRAALSFLLALGRRDGEAAEAERRSL